MNPLHAFLAGCLTTALIFAIRWLVAELDRRDQEHFRKRMMRDIAARNLLAKQERIETAVRRAFEEGER